MNGSLPAKTKQRAHLRVLLCFIAVACLCAFYMNHAGAETQIGGGFGRVYEFSSNQNPDCYFHVQIDGDVFMLSGRFAEGNMVKDAYISMNGRLPFGRRDINMDRSTGDFSAEIFQECNIDTIGYLYVVMDIGQYNIRLYHDESGWYFPDNGLDDKTLSIVKKNVDVSDEISAMYVSDTLNREEAVYAGNEIKRIAAEVTAGIDNDYDKAKALSRWAADNVAYDKDAHDSAVENATISLYNVLTKRRTVCSGYANLFGALCEAVGIKAVTIHGSIVDYNNGGYEQLENITVLHEYSAFWCDDQNRWVYADVTWDSENIYENGVLRETPVSGFYFDMTPFMFSFVHRGDYAQQRRYLNAVDYIDSLTAETTTAATTAQTTAQTTVETAAQTSAETQSLDIIAEISEETPKAAAETETATETEIAETVTETASRQQETVTSAVTTENPVTSATERTSRQSAKPTAEPPEDYTVYYILIAAGVVSCVAAAIILRKAMRKR
jgi:hypothetical protein